MTDFEKVTKELERLRELFPNTVIVTATQLNRNGQNQTWIPVSRNRYGKGPDVIYVDYVSLIKEPTIEDDGN